jgi:murein DD-endopeptidase MepM/ murein hydrolase activator NlpD
MITSRFIYAAIVLLLFAQNSSAGCNSDQSDLISGKNKFVCPLSLVPPLQTAGTVRGPDACAKEGGTVSANRGTGKKHNALDINSVVNTQVLAAKPGLVAVSANWDPSGAGVNMGNVVIIDHEDGDYTVYGHLNSRDVKKGDCVSAGQIVGTVGFTGNSSFLVKNKLPPHLHFAVIRAAKSGLASSNGPIASAVKNANDWLEFGTDFWGNDVVDLGIKDPRTILKMVPSCIDE